MPCRSASRRNSGLPRDLRHRVPHRHVDRADRHRAVAVPARLLVRHHAGPDAIRIEILLRRVQQRSRIGLQDARGEAFADQPALAVAAIGIEPVADHAPSVALDVGHHGDKARCHLREIDVGVADRRADRLRDLAHVGDAYWHGAALAVPNQGSAHSPRRRNRCAASSPDDALRIVMAGPDRPTAPAPAPRQRRGRDRLGHDAEGREPASRDIGSAAARLRRAMPDADRPALSQAAHPAMPRARRATQRPGLRHPAHTTSPAFHRSTARQDRRRASTRRNDRRRSRPGRRRSGSPPCMAAPSTSAQANRDPS